MGRATSVFIALLFLAAVATSEEVRKAEADNPVTGILKDLRDVAAGELEFFSEVFSQVLRDEDPARAAVTLFPQLITTLTSPEVLREKVLVSRNRESASASPDSATPSPLKSLLDLISLNQINRIFDVDFRRLFDVSRILETLTSAAGAIGPLNTLESLIVSSAMVDSLMEGILSPSALGLRSTEESAEAVKNLTEVLKTIVAAEFAAVRHAAMDQPLEGLQALAKSAVDLVPGISAKLAESLGEDSLEDLTLFPDPTPLEPPQPRSRRLRA